MQTIRTMWKAIFQNKLTIYNANLPSFVQNIIKSRCYTDLSRRLRLKSHPKMAAWERLIRRILSIVWIFWPITLILVWIFQIFRSAITFWVIWYTYLSKFALIGCFINFQKLKIRVALSNRVRCVWTFKLHLLRLELQLLYQDVKICDLAL
jgi:hypothetical protein